MAKWFRFLIRLLVVLALLILIVQLFGYQTATTETRHTASQFPVPSLSQADLNFAIQSVRKTAATQARLAK
jgi:hypothetical protein